jgi:hypothetical protein
LSTKLAIPLSGAGRMTRDDNNLPVSGQQGTIAAWQGGSKEFNTSTIEPTRVVVRIDGNIVKLNNTEQGFPCAVLRIDYSIGGYSRSVLVDAVNQSALVLWCNSLEVTPQWDERRITRLASEEMPQSYNPCKEQLLAAAVSATISDVGAANARYLDVLGIDATTEVEEPGDPPTVLTREWSIHPIPNGARAVRFLNATRTTGDPDEVFPEPVSVADEAALIIFICGTPAEYLATQRGFLESVNNGMTDTSQIMVPVDATHLLVAFDEDSSIDDYDTRSWLEWIIAPDSGVAF